MSSETLKVGKSRTCENRPSVKNDLEKNYESSPNGLLNLASYFFLFKSFKKYQHETYCLCPIICFCSKLQVQKEEENIRFENFGKFEIYFENLVKSTNFVQTKSRCPGSNAGKLR